MSAAAQQAGWSQGPVKPEPDPMIRLKVLDQEGRRAFHTLRMSDKLQAVMDAYYAKAAPDVTYGTGTFLFDGARLQGCKTPAGFDLIDGDEIDFFEVQLEGGAAGGTVPETCA